MQSLTKKFAAFSAVAVLGTASLVFAAQSPRHHARGADRMGGALASVLTDAQKPQAKSIFQEARQSAQPIRQQLMETRKSLRAAIQANDTAQIQQLSATEGNEMRQLKAVHSAAFAKVYQMLTPDQQQKLTALQQSKHPRHHAPASNPAGE